MQDTRRRLLIAAGATLAVPPACTQRDQQRVHRITIMHTAPAFNAAFLERMKALGYVAGTNLQVDVTPIPANTDTLELLMPAAAEAARRGADLILAGGGEAVVKAIVAGAPKTPLVMLFIDLDPVASGLVASLAQPGGNVTGIYSQNVELAAKRLAFLHEAVPGTRRVVVLFDAATRGQLESARDWASAPGISLLPQELLGNAYDFPGALREGVRQGADSVLVLSSARFYNDRDALARMIREMRLPSVGNVLFADSGLLLGYGPSFPAMFAQAANHADRILRGRRPGELPIEQADRFERVVNFATAQALGLAIPEAVLATADRVVR